jgi:hypothetical protein
LVRLDLLIGFPNFALRNIERFGVLNLILPLPVVRSSPPGNATSSVPPNYRAFIPTTSGSAPVLRLGTLALAGVTCLNFSLCITTTQRQVFTFLIEACASVTPPSCRTPDSPSTGSVCPDPGASIPPGFGVASGFRHVISGLLADTLYERCPLCPRQRFQTGPSGIRLNFAGNSSNCTSRSEDLGALDGIRSLPLGHQSLGQASRS